MACSSDDDGGADTTAPASEVADDPLHGTWDIVSVGSYHTWDPDGTWFVASSPRGAPYDFGTYSVEGSVVTVVTDSGSPECPGTTGSYVVTFVDADNISWELIEDDCAVRGANVPRAPWERYEAGEEGEIIELALGDRSPRT